MAPKKIRCSLNNCNEALKPSDMFVGECTFCNKKYCGKHRLLEDHNCENLKDCKAESHERNAARLEAERTQVIRGV